MEFTDEQIKYSIVMGSVYKFRHEDFKSKEAHFFVVVNPNPLIDNCVVMVCATSKLLNCENRIKWWHQSIDTLVKVGPKECGFLSLPSYFDCNSIVKFTPEEVVKRFKSKKLIAVDGTIKVEILSKLRASIQKSTRVENIYKKMVRGEEIKD